MSEKPLSISALNAMRVADVRTYARSLGIDLGDKGRKGDYIEAIKAAGGAVVLRHRNKNATENATEPKQDVHVSEREHDAEHQPHRERERHHDIPMPSQRADRGNTDRASRQLDSAQQAAALEALGDAAQRKAENRRHRKQDARDAVNELTRSRAAGSDTQDDENTGANDGASDASHTGRSNRVRNRDWRERSGRDRAGRAGRDRTNKATRDRHETAPHNARGDSDSTYESYESNAEEHWQDNTSNAQQVDTRSSEDVLLPVAGILDIAGTNSYLRTGGYLPGKNDAYVGSQIIKKYGLRRGDAVVGAVRSLAESPQRRGQRQHKYNPLVEVTAINGLSPEDSAGRPEFNKLTPLYPQEMLRMETTKTALTGRVIDLLAPIGKGQRGLIVSPPKAGKTVTMQQLAKAIATNNPEAHLMVVLVDERPEEVTDMQRLVKGEVIASTFDRPASDHAIVSELAVERAKRLVELGQDVVILLDSLTRLSRAYNLATPASGRVLSGGVDASALYPPKKFFGAARNIENGGSLTIIASALVETGSKMDEVIFEEFKGTGNMELRLSRELADRRIFPAVDINASGTRREELLFSPEELKIVWHLRRALGMLDVQEASDYLLGRLRKTESNKDFLVSVVRSMQ